MRFLFFLYIIVVAMGCATSKESDVLNKPQVSLTEIKAPPAPLKDDVVSVMPENPTLDQKSCIDVLDIDSNGFVVSEPKLMSLADLRLYAEQIYSDSVANSAICTAHLDATWNQLRKADEILDDIHKKENSWWNRNSGTITFATGFVIGVGSSILIVYGLDKATE